MLRGNASLSKYDPAIALSLYEDSLGRKVAHRLLCAKFNDCRKLGGGGACWEGLDWNMELLREPLGGKVFLRTTRDVVEGEELFYDYGAAYWEEWDPS